MGTPIKQVTERPSNLLVISLAISGAIISGCLGFMIGIHQWAYMHAKEIQSITEHVINAKAELEAGNRSACSDQLAQITTEFQKLY